MIWWNYLYFQSGRIGADEEIDDTKGKTMEEIDEMIEERELKAGTQILEMVCSKFNQTHCIMGPYKRMQR